MQYVLRISEIRWAELQKALWSRDDVESAAVVFVRTLSTDGTIALIVTDIRVASNVDYRDRRKDYLELSPTWINGCCREARALGYGVLTVHTHLHEGPPAFSWADDQGDGRLLPAVEARVAPAVAGSIVVSTSDAVARILVGGDRVPVRLCIAGRRVVTFPRAQPAVSAAHARQVLAIGPHGHAALEDFRVGIVGLGGTGSIVHLLLRHLGVRNIVALEPDILEDSNRSRVVGTRIADLAGVATKVSIADRLARDIQGDKAMFETHIGHLADERDARRLLGRDIIFCCVDRLLPRALLNDLAYVANIPVIDMGSAFRVADDGHIVSQGGKVALIGPGHVCLWCWGDLDPDRLRAETLRPDEREALAAEGYVEGAEVAQPAVVAFNAEIASAAVIEAMRMVTAFAGAEDPADRLNFDFRRGTVARVRGRSRSGCRFCGRGRPGDPEGEVPERD